MPYYYKEELLRQQKVLNKHEKNEEKWLETAKQKAFKARKFPYQSLIMSGESTRLKKEASDLLENCKSYYEVYGEKVWKMTLRDNEIDNSKVFSNIKIKDHIRS